MIEQSLSGKNFWNAALQVSILALVLGLVSLTPITEPVEGNAQTVTGETPYGGQEFYWILCTCTGNTWHFIFDYTESMPLPLIYQEGLSELYLNFNPFGTYLLGTYMEGGGTCEIIVGNSCAEIPSEGMMGMLPGTGTTL